MFVQVHNAFTISKSCQKYQGYQTSVLTFKIVIKHFPCTKVLIYWLPNVKKRSIEYMSFYSWQLQAALIWLFIFFLLSFVVTINIIIISFLYTSTITITPNDRYTRYFVSPHTNTKTNNKTK